MKKSDIRNKIGLRIKELRRESGISQETFANSIGINRSHLAEIETGNRNFGIDTLDKIVNGFGIAYADFFRKL